MLASDASVLTPQKRVVYQWIVSVTAQRDSVASSAVMSGSVCSQTSVFSVLRIGRWCLVDVARSVGTYLWSIWGSEFLMNQVWGCCNWWDWVT